MLHQGRFYKVAPFDENDGKPWDIDRIEQMFLQIENIAETEGTNDVDSVGVLTTLDRRDWAEVNNYKIFDVELKM